MAGQGSQAVRQRGHRITLPGHEPFLSQTSGPPTLSQLLAPRPVGDDGVKSARRGSPEYVTPPASPPPRRPLASTANLRSDPANPQRPNIVKEWMAIFEARGRFGLEEAIHAYAEHQWSNLPTADDELANAREIWGHMMTDRIGNSHYVLSLLRTLPDFMILALLRCDLPCQMAQNPKVNDYVVRYMGLTEHPSIYMTVVHDINGLFLSSLEMEQLFTKMERYLTVDAEPRQDQIQIDNSQSPWNPNPGEPQLRFRANDRAEKITRDWIALARKTHCTDPIDSSTRSCLVPSEVGWAINPENRCKALKDNFNTTSIFGLVNAILCMPSAFGGFDFPPPLEILLFPIWDRNLILCHVARLLGRCLTSSYSSLGGFNCHSVVPQPDDEQGLEEHNLPTDDSPNWEANAESFLRRISFEEPIHADMQKAREWNNTLLRAVKVDATKLARKEAEEERDRLAAELRVKKEKVEQLRQETDELRRENYGKGRAEALNAGMSTAPVDLVEQLEEFGRVLKADKAEQQRRLQELRERTRRRQAQS